MKLQIHSVETDYEVLIKHINTTKPLTINLGEEIERKINEQTQRQTVSSLQINKKKAL